MSPQVGTTTLTSAQTLTDSYVLADNALNAVDRTSPAAKWFQLYGETQTSLEISYTTGAAETSNYLEFYIQYGSGAPELITWTDETVEYYDDSANQLVLEGWTYRLDGASAATAYTKRVNLPVCTKGIRIYVKEVGVAANYGTVTIKANTVAAGAGFYNRYLQTVTLEAGANSGLFADDSAFTIATDYVMGIGALADETATDSVNEGDIGILRMTLNRRVITAGNLLDDGAFGIGTDYVTPIGFLADETASDSVDEGDVGLARMTLDRKILSAETQQHDAAATAYVAMIGSEAKTFDGSALPNAVNAEGDIVRNAASLSGVLYMMPTTQDGSATPIIVHDVPIISGVGMAGTMQAFEAKTFDGAALPNTVSTEGDGVRGAASLSGVQFVMPVNQDGSKSPIKNEDDASADGDAGYVILAKNVTSPAASSGTAGDYEQLQITAGRLNTAPGAALTGPGNPVIDSITHVAFNLAAGANQVLVASAPNKQIWVFSIAFTVNVAGTVSFQDEDDTAITGIMQFGATGGMAIAPSGNFAMPIWKLATNKDLEVDVVTSELDGFLTYALVSV